MATWCLSDWAAEQAFLENNTQRLWEEAVDRWQNFLLSAEITHFCSERGDWTHPSLNDCSTIYATGKNPIPSSRGEKSVWFLSTLKLFISIRELTQNCMCPLNVKTGIWQTVRVHSVEHIQRIQHVLRKSHLLHFLW